MAILNVGFSHFAPWNENTLKNVLYLLSSAYPGESSSSEKLNEMDKGSPSVTTLFNEY